MLDRQYSLRAQEVGTGDIKTAEELYESMREYVPTDSEFEDAFAIARVSKQFLARYYLRAIDKTLKDDPEPEFVQSEDESMITLEHIMPIKVTEAWDVDSDTTLMAQKLLGNMVLLRATKNVALGNGPFEEKKKEYAESSYLVTSQVGNYDAWTIEEIRHRQAELAKIAVKTWPLRIR